MARISDAIKLDVEIATKAAAEGRRHRLRGFGNDSLGSLLDDAKKQVDNPKQHKPLLVSADYEDDDSVPRTSDSADPGDKMGHEKKLDIKYWPRPPITDEEKAIYYGLHFHSLDNKFGLHTHMPGGQLSGGHTHGPQNLLGAHHHRVIVTDPDTRTQDPPGIMIDGQHVHNSQENMPTGDHGHTPENFG